ncbi:hypothetical protein T09_10347 [Trichinella sp. T9]|nr:hypothetical protein T09_10347 [Trichinella sp. T9]
MGIKPAWEKQNLSVVPQTLFNCPTGRDSLLWNFMSY